MASSVGSSGSALKYSFNGPMYNSNGTPISRTEAFDRSTNSIVHGVVNGNLPASAGSGTSAASVSQTQDVPSSLGDYMSWINELTDRNTARSEAQAAELRDWQSQQNQIAMQFNSAEAAKNRDWQKMMSDTAHQREVRDLQAAGLNPVLSAMGGNGASVTSGATASGVTSAGAKGEVDTSASSALVGILGSLLTAQTELEMQRNTAQNNMAIAEKQNATSELVARLYTEQSREASQLAAVTGLQQAQISAATSELVSRISANASYYSSNVAKQNAILQTEAQKVVAGMNVDASKYNTTVNGLVNLAQQQMSYDIADLTSGRSASSAMDVAKENHANSQMGTLYNIWKTGTDILSGKFTGFGSSGQSWSSGHRGGGFSK